MMKSMPPIFIAQTKLLKLCQKLKIIPNDLIPLSHLEHHISIEKQLDEYRELIEEIEKQTHFFSHGKTPWSKNHARTLDECLQTLCQHKHRNKKKGEFCKIRIRPRPTAIENNQTP